MPRVDTGALTPPEPPAARPRPTPRRGGWWGALASVATSALALALLAVTWAGRELSAPPAALTAAVTLLPYLYVTLAVWCFTLWSIVPDRRAPPLWLAVSTVLAAALWGPAWASRPQVADGAEIRMMSWNLRRLWGGPDDDGDPLRCAITAIGDADPDVLTLLEVSRDDLDALEAALDMTCAHSPYIRSASPRKGGLAACARHRWSLVSGGPQRFVDDEDWYYVSTEVERGGRVFNLLAVHLYPYAFAAKHLRRDLTQLDPDDLSELSRDGSQTVKAQSDQSAALLDRVARFRDPTVVAGDFNSTRDAALHVALRRSMTDAWERGGTGFGATIDLLDHLPLRIDYVYASDDFAVADATVPDVGCSDHRPVVTRLVLRRDAMTGQ